VAIREGGSEMSGDMSDWLRRYQERQAALKKYGESCLDYAMEALQFLGVKEVTVEYDGSGDDGEVQQPQFDPVPPEGLPQGLESLIHEACCHMLPGGWEINEGSFGAIYIDVEKGKVEVDHEWREEEAEEDEWE
jgi:hypothetical protein